jgi:SAM-dependent methyltransferase
VKASGAPVGARRPQQERGRRFVDYCACPRCRGLFSNGDRSLVCNSCGTAFEVRCGIPILLEAPPDDEHARYRATYEQIATHDLAEPLEVASVRQARHDRLISFIGDVSGKRVLDIGSSHALYLRRLDAGFKVAFDIAYAYLEEAPRSDHLVAVCGDAEKLPFRAGFFDVIIISDVLEHLFDPDQLVARIRDIARTDTRVIVEVPWEEELSSYGDQQWEFTHLRKFDLYSFSDLWSGFEIVRRRASTPRLERPVFLQDRLPLPLSLLNFLRYAVYHRSLPGNRSLGAAEYEWRRRLIQNLPRRERLLLLACKPLVHQFELRLFDGSPYPARYDRLLQRLERLSTFRQRWPSLDRVAGRALGRALE